MIHRPSATPSSGPPSDGTTICPTRIATWAGALKFPYTGDPIGKTRTKANRVSQPERNERVPRRVVDRRGRAEELAGRAAPVAERCSRRGGRCRCRGQWSYVAGRA